MSDQLFSMASEAAAWIEENLVKGAEALKEEARGEPLIPSLGFACGYQRWKYLISASDANLI